ncbi:unnamed protein product, partial [Cyprideis torosa]
MVSHSSRSFVRVEQLLGEEDEAPADPTTAPSTSAEPPPVKRARMAVPDTEESLRDMLEGLEELHTRADRCYVLLLLRYRLSLRRDFARNSRHQLAACLLRLSNRLLMWDSAQVAIVRCLAELPISEDTLALSVRLARENVSPKVVHEFLRMGIRKNVASSSLYQELQQKTLYRDAETAETIRTLLHHV